VVGQSITYTATVTASAPGTGTPTGTVTFAGDAGTLCTVALNRAVPDQATCTTSEAHAGDDSVTATYGGDPNYTGSPSSSVGEDVAAASTTTSLAETSGSTVAGQEITFTATVVTVSPGSGTPSGTVDFVDNGSVFCSTALSDTTPDQAACSTSFPTSGSLLVTAQYVGSNDDSSSTSNTLSESVGAAQTTTTVTASAEPSVTGQNVTLTATVAPVAPSTGVPAGALLFSVETAGGKSLPCSGGDTHQLSNGAANCTITGTKLSPAAGPLAVTAVFDGTASYQTSQDSITHGIDAAATTVLVVSKDTPTPPGKAVTFTAAVSATAPGAGRPQGTVTFSFSPAGTLACVQGDTVTLSPANKPVSCKMAKGAITEPVTVTATYSGSPSYLTGSGSVSQAVL
jgi:hypothetical protein